MDFTNKRYTRTCFGMKPDPNGTWMLYDNQQKIVQEHAAFKKALTEIASNWSWTNFVAAHEIAKKALENNNPS